MIYALAFYVPAGAIAVCWAVVLLRANKRGEAGHILLWLAVLFTVAAAVAAVWAISHTPQLRARLYIDYRYEVAALFASLMGFAFGVVWSVRPGQRLGWLATVSSLWLALLWFVVMTTGSS
jgi:hypothetical protein